MSTLNSRRDFVKKGVLGAMAGSVLGGSSSLAADTQKIQSSDLKLGFAGYTFVHFNLEEAIEMIEKMDVNYLCIKDFHLPLDSTPDQIEAFHKRLKASNIEGYAVGPIYTKTREDIDNAFEYAKRVGVDMIVGIPQKEDLEYLSTKVQEYEIRYAIHNHGPEDKLYPNATVIVELIENLDKRIGLCFDIGHNMRDGHDPIRDLNRYKDRIFDIHLKDVSAAEAEGKTCELGRGVIDIPAFVDMLKKVNYAGICALEYEKDMKDPMAGIAESVGYFNGVLDAKS